MLLNHKRHEVLIHATTWMNLENMLYERSQSQKSTSWMNPFICNSQNRKAIETECRLVVAIGWEKGITGGCDS
jgi:hypothetical protein